MKCERAQEQFSDYHEGTLGRSFVVALENHITECSTCRSDLQELKSVWQILDDAPVVEPPADFRAQVWRRIDEAEQAKSRRPAPAFNWRSLFGRPAFALAGAALLILVLMPVVLPGTRAGLGFIWSPFSRSNDQSVGVTALSTQTRMVNGEQVLVLPLKASGSAVVRAEVRVVSGPASLDASSDSVDLGGSANSEVLVHLQPGSSGQTVTVELRWKESSNERVKTFEVNAP
jgi:hypothetical protein